MCQVQQCDRTIDLASGISQYEGRRLAPRRTLTDNMDGSVSACMSDSMTSSMPCLTHKARRPRGMAGPLTFQE